MRVSFRQLRTSRRIRPRQLCATSRDEVTVMSMFEPSRMYRYVRARQLEGSFPGDHRTGAHIVSAMRIARGWGVPSEKEWPYDGAAAHWPPQEPADIDVAAKKNRICAYQRVRTLDELKNALTQQHRVQINVPITDEWYTTPNGKIEMPKPDTTRAESHSVHVVGFDDAQGCLTIENSWGSAWGDKGFGYIPQRYFEKFQTEAWTMAPDPLPSSQKSGIYTRAWGLPDLFSKTPLVGLEVVDGTKDECVGWAFLVARQGYADIEELFVKPSYRGKRYGSELVRMIKERPELKQLPLRLWISHADALMVKSEPVRRIVSKLGLSVNPSVRRWAPFVGM